MSADWFFAPLWSLQSLHLSDVLQWATGQTGAAGNYMIARWIFLRVLGVVYLIAFVSLWVQIKGLIGSNGILPLQEYLGAAKSQLGAERFTEVPTVFWFNASDAALHIVCAIGVLCSALLILGIAPVPSLVVLWALYLSLTVAGQEFLSFQWDILLIEVGFLAIFLAPLNLLPGIAHETPVPPIILFLFWFLLFRFLFESGVVKLTSGDRSWLDLTALTYHYETQPLATWTAWYIHQMPLWFHKASVVFNHLVEVGFPFLIFGTKQTRLIAVAGIIGLQLIIGATGNYTFFGLLTIGLSFLVLDDSFWMNVLPEKLLQWIGEPGIHGSVPLPLIAFSVLFACITLIVGGAQIAKSVRPAMRIPRFALVPMMWTQPWYLINPYGLFRVMTKERPEIIIEGSSDGQSWLPYEFRWKAGDVNVRPGFVEPHQPRLDWQMWFAALSSYDYVPWFQNLMVRLLQGSPDVLALLKTNPFPTTPPKFLRAKVFDYHFTDFMERGKTGAWWKRTETGLYAPVMSLE